MRRPKKILEQAALLENAFSEIVIRFLSSWIAVGTAGKIGKQAAFSAGDILRPIAKTPN